MVKFIVSILVFTISLFSFNIESATESELVSLNGVGEVLAKRIIEYREQYGLSSIDQLTEVRGIGEKKLQKIKKQLGLNDEDHVSKNSAVEHDNHKAEIDLSKYDE